MSENWKAVVGYEGLYEVSDQGRVRSLARKGVRQTRILKATPNNTGYPVVGLYKHKTRKIYTVHSLVMGSFVGPRPQGTEVCHANHDKADPRLLNLRYDTHLANMNDPGTASTAGYGAVRGSSGRPGIRCSRGHLVVGRNAKTVKYRDATRDRCRVCTVRCRIKQGDVNAETDRKYKELTGLNPWE